jgi:hypothetical protein
MELVLVLELELELELMVPVSAFLAGMKRSTGLTYVGPLSSRREEPSNPYEILGMYVPWLVRMGRFLYPEYYEFG